MKDLELRGTGNLLGDEQSGHIEGVGFDLYVRMVSEAVEQYKEPERKESVAVTIDLPIEASIPVDYIDSDKLRLEAYQKLASARTEDDLDELRDELTDRYGKPPVDFEALFDVARLRFKARKLGISEIIAQGRNVRVSKFEPRESVQDAHWSESTKGIPVPAVDQRRICTGSIRRLAWFQADELGRSGRMDQSIA